MTVSTELTIGIVAFYLVMIIGIGYYGYRRTKKVEDYMVAGRNTHPAIIALSYGATFISTSAIIGFGGTSAQYGMSLMWMTVLCIVVGVIIAFICMGKRIRRIGKDLGALTYPELLGNMYGSKKIIYATGAIFVAAMPLYTAAVLIGGARFIETTLGIPYLTALLGFAGVVALYVVIGGLMAVMYTDAVQGAIMLVGMGILLVLTYIYLGGVTAAHSSLESMSGLVPSTLSSMGMTGWTSMPEFGSPIWMTVITTLVLGVGVGVLAQPQLAVRFMTAKDGKSLNRAIPIGALFIVMMTGVAFTVGPLTNVYFMDKLGMLAIEAAGGKCRSDHSALYQLGNARIVRHYLYADAAFSGHVDTFISSSYYGNHARRGYLCENEGCSLLYQSESDRYYGHDDRQYHSRCNDAGKYHCTGDCHVHGVMHCRPSSGVCSRTHCKESFLSCCEMEYGGWCRRLASLGGLLSHGRIQDAWDLSCIVRRRLSGRLTVVLSRPAGCRSSTLGDSTFCPDPLGQKENYS